MLAEKLKNGKRKAGLFSDILQLEIQELSVITCFSCAANKSILSSRIFSIMAFLFMFYDFCYVPTFEVAIPTANPGSI